MKKIFVPVISLAIAWMPTAAMAAHLSLGNAASLPNESAILVSQLSVKPDLDLLAKASALFMQSDRYQTESNILVKADSGGTSVTSSAQATTIMQAPNKFRSEIRFSKSAGSPGGKSTVVSDGRQVWMYRADLKQYKVVSYAAFSKSDDNYWIGMSSLWFLDVPADVRKEIANGALTNPKMLKELGLQNSQSLRGGTETVDGQSFYVYEFKDQEGLAIAGLVDPATTSLKQIRITGKSEGFDINITEQILQRSPNPEITATTFKFAPPAGTKQVKALAIGPL